MKYNFPLQITYGDMYGQLAKITTPEDAAEFFEACVVHCMKRNEGVGREEAMAIERSNIGYYSGYFDYATMVRVQELFSAPHPILGNMSNPESMSAEEIIKTGMEWASKE